MTMEQFPSTSQTSGLTPRSLEQLRKKIWNHVANQGRAVLFTLVEGRDPILTWQTGQGHGTVSEGRTHFKAHNPVPSILHTNKEARKIGLRHYNKCFEHHQGRYSAYVSLNDTLMVPLPDIMNEFYEEIYSQDISSLGGSKRGPLIYGTYGWREMAIATTVSITGWQGTHLVLLCKIRDRGIQSKKNKDCQLSWAERVELRKTIDEVNKSQGGGDFIYLSGIWRVLGRWEQVWGGLLDLFHHKNEEIQPILQGM